MIMKRPMVTFLTQLLLAIRSRFTGRARLEAENLILRQQLVVIRRKSPTRVRRLLALEIPPRRQSRIDCEIRALIRRMSRENPLWGAPRIHGELLMLGIDVAESTVGRYMVRRRRPPSQGWRPFLRNHAAGIASLDLFVVRTISFKAALRLSDPASRPQATRNNQRH